MKSMKLIFLIISTIIIFASSAFSVCPKPNPKVCAEYFKSDLVITGVVVFRKTINNDTACIGCADGHLYKVKVSKTFKGAKKKYIYIYTYSDSAEPLLMKTSKEYLLFLQWDTSRYTFTCCGNSCLLSEANKNIQEIEEIPKKKTGEIEGLVYANDGFAGVKVRIVGANKTYSAITDSSGWFHVVVIPGRYKVIIAPQRINNIDLSFKPYIFSYDNPNDFIVPKGGCAELAFEP